jgi:hypothetical protein
MSVTACGGRQDGDLLAACHVDVDRVRLGVAIREEDRLGRGLPERARQFLGIDRVDALAVGHRQVDRPSAFNADRSGFTLDAHLAQAR